MGNTFYLTVELHFDSQNIDWLLVNYLICI